MGNNGCVVSSIFYRTPLQYRFILPNRHLRHLGNTKERISFLYALNVYMVIFKNLVSGFYNLYSSSLRYKVVNAMFNSLAVSVLLPLV